MSKLNVLFTLLGFSGLCDGEVMRFITLGNSGHSAKGRMDPLAETASSIRGVCSRGWVSYVSLLGDLLCPSGTSALEDPLVSKTLPGPFAGIQSEIHPVLGDCDYGPGGDDSDDVRVPTSLTSFVKISSIYPEWRMKALFHRVFFESGGVSLCAIFLDTQSLISIIRLEDRSDAELAHLRSQMEWLEETLRSRKCQDMDFIVVHGHHPINSATRESPLLFRSGDLSDLLRMLQKYHVDAYFSAHSRDFQAITYKSPTEGAHIISHISSGSAGGVCESPGSSPDDRYNVWKDTETVGYTVTEVMADRMETHFIASHNNTVIHTHTTPSHKAKRSEWMAALSTPSRVDMVIDAISKQPKRGAA